MALVDDIEFYGRAVAAGDMPKAGAIRALAEASGGGLTARGAEDSIDGWQGVRSRYKAAILNSARLLDRIYGLDD